MNDAGVKRFGSGWTWLVWDGTGLAVKSTPNQDTPVMDGDDAAPRHRRVGARLLPQVPEPPPDYLEAWWNVVDWDAVAARFDAARGRGSPAKPPRVASA